MALPDCTIINNLFEIEANRISSQTSQKNWVGSPWDTNMIVPKTDWEDGMGESPNFLIFDRVTPLNGPITVEPVTFNNGQQSIPGGTCNPPTAVLYESTRRLSMVLNVGAVESRPFCVWDGRMSWDLAKQAENVLRQMQSNIRFAWSNFRRDEFTRIVSNKAVADAAMTTNASTFGTSTSIGQLQREMLDYWRYRLINDGADIDNSMVSDEYGQPVLPLILSPEAQMQLVNNGVTIQNIRWDSEKVKRLNSAPGAFDSLNGFKMQIDYQAPRWNLVGGTWVRVPFYSTVTTAGDPAVVNPAYQTANYEDLFIASNKVVKFAIPKSQLSAGPMSFPAQDYLGNVHWINEYDLQCNKDRNIGYFRALLSYGAQPVIPEYGVTLRFRRCPLNWTVDTTCS